MTMDDGPYPDLDLSEPMRLDTSYAGTVHWVSALVGPDRGNGKNCEHVQISDVLGVIDLDIEEARALHTWLSVLIGREVKKGRG